VVLAILGAIDGTGVMENNDPVPDRRLFCLVDEEDNPRTRIMLSSRRAAGM
jgi:hypothetical protein